MDKSSHTGLTEPVPWPESDQLATFEQVHQAIRAQAADINQQLGETPLLVISILHGAVVYSGLLLPELKMPLMFDALRVTRYGSKTYGSSSLKWLKKPETDVADKIILLLDDIFDEGKTLEAVDAWCRDQGAADVYSAVMLNKHHNRKPTAFLPTFSAMVVEDRYVFGMGMDYKETWRNASGIWAVN